MMVSLNSKDQIVFLNTQGKEPTKATASYIYGGT